MKIGPSCETGSFADTAAFSNIFWKKNSVFWVVTPCGSCWFLQEPHGVTTQKTPVFIVTAVKTSNLTYFGSLRLIAMFTGALHWYLSSTTSMKFWSSLMRFRPEKDPQQTAQYIYNISCECGRSYIDETGRPLLVWLHEHRHHLKEGLLEKSILAQNAYREGHRVIWDEARILETESNSRHRKCKESAHTVCLKTPASQALLDISPIWVPFISDQVTKPKRSP
jgi:hypothetical protein